jgi:general secretion pathway protein E
MTVRSDIQLDFAAGLRSILRQDPDIIFVGEIRDSETARTAVQAALTGHLVISTVHTNSALAAISRLVDLGVERFLLADVLRAVVGQRLVRRVCPTCGLPDHDLSSEQRAQALLPPAMLVRAQLGAAAPGARRADKAVSRAASPCLRPRALTAPYSRRSATAPASANW